ncbi:methyltransferase domain-containing protein [Chelativorans salis]|uniref:Methyltransferase domain-containing protein n=1 Tax=Chelativorans salis TaxID=2978478 RepID=A0ABT2LGU1_9HYPH|nr:MerC family mercury resistance protein [Chelativorans sp. EGI FJ00035]MCT7373736.1 methyltransferase domain-containing protein [Chelativorans sp. EGI FJ00035]
MVAILGYSKEQITEAVKAMYGSVADDPHQGFHFPVGRPAALAVGYPAEELDRLPRTAVDRFAGVGYPFRAGVIKRGDTVLDIGSGSGTDTLLASRLVGDAGKVWALDITPDMLARLKATLQEAGIRNVEPIEADAENIPLPDNSVDVVTSNGVLNLVPDKRKAFAEIFRVLKPEGRMQLSDIVIAKPVPVGGRSDPKLWAECVVGASIDEDYLELLRETGFADVEVLGEFDYFAESPSADTRRIAAGLGARSMEAVMRRPAEASRRAAPARFLRRLHPRRLKAISGRGLWGAVAAITAIVVCYGVMASIGLLSLIGVAFAFPEGAWATAIFAAAALAVIATAFNLPRHGHPWPLLVTAVGATLIGYAMFWNYNPLVEALGFTILIGGVVFDLHRLYLSQCTPARVETSAARPTLER